MTSHVSFADLLRTAVTEPGIVSTAYQQFHSYSVGNQILALGQCIDRGIRPGPLATYPRWKELGRWVRKGERAITLCMPLTIRRTAEQTTDDPEVFTKFVYRNSWFTLSQTDGEPMPEPLLPTWDKDRALTALQIAEVPFDKIDGNCLGFARERSIAINPLNPLPHVTRFHELAHVLLGHTSEDPINHDDRPPRNLRECEADPSPCSARLLWTWKELSIAGVTSSTGGGKAIRSRSGLLRRC